MKFNQESAKHETKSAVAQGQSNFFQGRHALVFVLGLIAIFTGIPCAYSQDETSSPLEILQHAPKVRFDDPQITPRPIVPRDTAPNPYYPQGRPAPPIQPVEPAFTPYAGNTTSNPPPAQRDPYYEPATEPRPPVMVPPGYGAPAPTPRPVLGPDDVQPKEKKGGFVRGLLNVIPFVGDDDEDEEPAEQTPEPAEEPTIYRGYDAAPPRDGTNAPILLPPGATPLQRTLPSDPEPSSPPIMTPFPRNAPAAVIEPAPDAPVLTVKRESDTTSTEITPDSSHSNMVPVDTDAKQPALSRSNDEAPKSIQTPIPLEHATTSVIIRGSRPSEDSLGPEPDPSATSLDPFDPTAAPVDVIGNPADELTTLVIEQSDLGMPNPTYEQNTNVLAEFQAAVRKARADDFAAAAVLFRDYGLNHPSSGLAPRAFFLSIIFEKNKPRAKENIKSLRRLFPESRYVDDIETRRPALFGPEDVAVIDAPPEETPRQRAERLEKELTVAVGDVNREPELRKDLGLAYLELEEYDRAYEVLRPAMEMSAGTPVEGEILMAMGRVLVARGETIQAISLYEAVEQKHPQLIYKDATSAWNVGLAFEGAGRYNKARAIYNNIRQRWPQTTEAGWASKRLTDLASLRR